jgi:hypothetical protein
MASLQGMARGGQSQAMVVVPEGVTGFHGCLDTGYLYSISINFPGNKPASRRSGE